MNRDFVDAAEWRPWMALAAAAPLPVLLVMLWPFLHFVWLDRPAYSHGYLVLGIVGWLAYRAARDGPLPPLAPRWLGAAALLMAVVVAAAGSAADVALLPQLAIPALPLATLWALAGAAAARRFVVPCLYLLFALPVWDVLNEPLRRLTVVVASALTRLAAIPAFIDGDVIRVPSGAFVVEGGCSGLHFLIVACALGALYGLLQYDRWWLRGLAVLVAAAVAIVANWARVFTIIVAGHLTEMQHYLVTVDHTLFGWALFFVFFAATLFVVRYFESRARPADGARAAPAGYDKTSVDDLIAVPRTLVCAIVLWAGVWLVHQATNRPIASASPTLDLALPATLGAWRAVGDWDEASRPRFMGADGAVSRSYQQASDGSGTVDVFVAHYGVQRQGKEAVFYANVVVAGGLDAVYRRAALESPEGTLLMTELEVGGVAEPRRVVWYGYRVAGRATGSPIVAKLYQVLGAIEGRWDAQVVIASARCEAADCAAARAALRGFMATAEPPLRELVATHSSAA